jgi:hypothetical protein
MQSLKFWGGAFWESLTVGWVVFGIVSTAMPALFTLIVRYWPKAGGVAWIKWASDHQSELHVALALLCVLLYSLYVPYRLFNREHAARLDVEKKLAARPAPPIHFDVSDIEGRKLAQDDITKLRSENEELKTQLNEIQKSDRWGLTDEQFDVLSSNLKTSAALEPIPSDEQAAFISCVMGDAGSMRFAEKLSLAFKKAGWKFKGDSGYNQAIFEPIPEGVAFHVHSKEDVPRALNTLAGTLRYFGIDSTGYIREQIPPGHFDVVIGLKPESSKRSPTPNKEASPH